MERKSLKDLNLIDRFLFAEAMEDADTYQAVLEIILGREIRLKTGVQSEKELRTLPSFRGIRLDVWGADEEDAIYNSEMQKENTQNLPRRSRFYQSVMDAGLLKPGVINFNTLNDVWLIMISPFDLFGQNRCRYTFRMRCDESEELELSDGAVRIFLNTRGENKDGISEELQALLRYVEHSDEEAFAQCGSERMKQIHKRVTQVKSNEESEVRYVQFWEEKVMERQAGIMEGEERGEKLGEKAKALEVAKNMYARGFSAEDAAGITAENIDTIKELYKKWDLEKQQK